GWTVGLLYFSNAEQFFYYTPDFVRNMNALPFADRAMVVRTIHHRRISNAPDDDWHYMVEEAGDFLERLETGFYKRSFALIADLLAAGAPFLGQEGISTMGLDTPRALLEAYRLKSAGKASAYGAGVE